MSGETSARCDKFHFGPVIGPSPASISTLQSNLSSSCFQCDNYEIRSGKYLGVCISVANNRLFVGSIPKNKTRESILEDFGKVTGQIYLGLGQFRFTFYVLWFIISQISVM